MIPRTGPDVVTKRKTLILLGMKPWFSSPQQVILFTELTQLNQKICMNL